MKVPFLKNKKVPRIAVDPPEAKLINGNSSDLLEERCTTELMDAAGTKDVKKFRAALEALVMNCFEDPEDE